jgi:hypothetical protein
MTIGISPGDVGKTRIEAEILSVVAVSGIADAFGFNGFREAMHSCQQLQHHIANSPGTMRQRMN